MGANWETSNSVPSLFLISLDRSGVNLEISSSIPSLVHFSFPGDKLGNSPFHSSFAPCWVGFRGNCQMFRFTPHLSSYVHGNWEISNKVPSLFLILPG